MKKSVYISLLALAIVLCSVFSFAAKNELVLFDDTKEMSANVVLLSGGSENASEKKIGEARFLNMLNHSFVYGDDFFSVEDMVNASMPALISNIEDGYIAEVFVKNYIFDMFGIEIEDFSLINAHLDAKEGYVPVMATGYTVYEHKAISLKENEDGSFTFITEVIIDAHDSEKITDRCETLFVKNEASAFGYSIIFSEMQSSKNVV